MTDLDLRMSGGLVAPLDERRERPEYPTWPELGKLDELERQLESARAGEAVALERVAELEAQLRCSSTCLHGDRCTLGRGHTGGHNHRECACNEPNHDCADLEYSCPPQWIKDRS